MFDDQNLIAYGGLEPVVRLAKRCGLPALAGELVLQSQILWLVICVDRCPVMLMDVRAEHVEGWAEELAVLTGELGHLFARPEPREVFADLTEKGTVKRS
ncbi:hypothetical protein OHB54_44775 [Streptomyces sp. NBC_01007]|nr:hypothetical protein OHB54_44775 [Streptomyces sp. NBC_01007]